MSVPLRHRRPSREGRPFSDEVAIPEVTEEDHSRMYRRRKSMPPALLEDDLEAFKKHQQQQQQQHKRGIIIAL